MDVTRHVPHHEKPTVTVAVLCYNQRDYIVEAIDGALSQTYKPLEVIVCDDCSTDGTFEIATQHVAAYRGSVSVRLLQNERNLGIGGNVRRAFEQAHGEIVILAAGDDVSLPSRADATAEQYVANPRLMATLSMHAIIDASGSVLKAEAGQLGRTFNKLNPALMSANGGGYGLGAAYSYRKDVALWPAPIPSDLANEDRLLPLRASILGEVRFIPKVLVKYRLSPAGLSRAVAKREIIALAKRSHVEHVAETLRAARTEKRLAASSYWVLRLVLALARWNCNLALLGDERTHFSIAARQLRKLTRYCIDSCVFGYGLIVTRGEIANGDGN